jgi:lambda family phage portal protein
MNKVSGILDASGTPLRSLPKKAAASLGGSAPQFFPYDAAQWYSTEMGDWLPWIRSPDTEINLYRDRIVARSRDLVRNDGWASGAIQRIIDSTIGGDYRLIASPDYRALSYYDKAFDATWANEFRQAAEAKWRNYANDVGHYNDLARDLTVTQQFRQSLSHKLIDGESLIVGHWRPDRLGRGAARYATTYQIVDPDRISNPYQQVDTKYLRGGVEIDDDGVTIAGHIRRAHQNDWYNAIESMEWERVPREDGDGWQRLFLDFDRTRAGQHRGVSVFAPILSRMKMLATYYGVELQAATIASVFGTFITSPFDQQMIEEALEAPGELNGLGFYQDLRSEFHEKNKLMLNNARIPTLAPGEQIQSVAATRPNDKFSPFTHEMLRSVAAALGVSAEMVTQDYSETNYSSARAGIVEAEKMFTRRIADFNTNTATPIYAQWLWEAIDRDELPMPLNAGRAPSFQEAKNEYSRCRWLGAARGWVDPVAERQGAILGLDAGFSTLEQECASQGMDWEENLEQRAREVARFKELGLNLPEWGGVAISAMQASQPAEKPQAA